MTRNWLFGGLLLTLPLSAAAGEIKMNPVGVPVAFTRTTADGTKVDVVLEASAVEPIANGSLVLVAHDKKEPLLLAETSTGRIVADGLSCASFPKGLAVGPKWEGMARDAQGFFYLIGAHSGKTLDEKLQKSYLFRFKLKGEGAETAIDETSVVRWHCADSLVSSLNSQVSDPLEAAKLKIEGLAIRNIGDRTELVVGFREPGDVVRVHAADVSGAPSTESALAFKPLFHFPAGQREGVASMLTSLHYLSAWKGFLVVTAAEDADNVFHGNTLWFVPDTSANGGVAKAERIADFEPAMKAEGLAELPGATQDMARLVITYDNDPHSTKMPSRIQTVTISRQP